MVIVYAWLALPLAAGIVKDSASRVAASVRKPRRDLTAWRF
jgi:hypothetical protein